MIILPLLDVPPADCNVDLVRTYWVCPTFCAPDTDSPVACRSSVEDAITSQFAGKFEELRSVGATHIWLGEPMRDQVDWMDCRIWYPIRALFVDPPPQLPRPFRLSPLAPDYPQYLDGYDGMTRGIDLMRDGNFKEGLPLYELRWNSPQGWTQWMTLEYPHWDGKAKGRILIHAEQGAGDMIQFARHLKHLKGIDADLLCPSGMADLLKTVDFGGKVITGTVEQYDYHIPLCSLPVALGLDVIEQCRSYLSSDEDKAAAMWKKLVAMEPWNIKPKVGICWSGSPDHPLNQYRCLSLEQILQHAPKGSRIFSLQVGPAREQLKHAPPELGIIDLMDECKTWADTAALIDNLDLVVTIDSGVAHLCGALGKRVKMVMSGSSDWRWGHSGITTPLYPSMEIVREDK